MQSYGLIGGGVSQNCMGLQPDHPLVRSSGVPLEDRRGGENKRERESGGYM